MSQKSKLLLLAYNRPKSLHFSEFRLLLEALGFRLSRINGSHHIFVHPDIPERINIQNVNGMVKPYQVRQLLDLVEWYNLKIEDEE